MLLASRIGLFNAGGYCAVRPMATGGVIMLVLDKVAGASTGQHPLRGSGLFPSGPVPRLVASRAVTFRRYAINDGLSLNSFNSFP